MMFLLTVLIVLGGELFFNMKLLLFDILQSVPIAVPSYPWIRIGVSADKLNSPEGDARFRPAPSAVKRYILSGNVLHDRIGYQFVAFLVGVYSVFA